VDNHYSHYRCRSRTLVPSFAWWVYFLFLTPLVLLLTVKLVIQEFSSRLNGCLAKVVSSLKQITSYLQLPLSTWCASTSAFYAWRRTKCCCLSMAAQNSWSLSSLTVWFTSPLRKYLPLLFLDNQMLTILSLSVSWPTWSLRYVVGLTISLTQNLHSIDFHAFKSKPGHVHHRQRTGSYLLNGQ